MLKYIMLKKVTHTIKCTLKSLCWKQLISIELNKNLTCLLAGKDLCFLFLIQAKSKNVQPVFLLQLKIF